MSNPQVLMLLLCIETLILFSLCGLMYTQYWKVMEFKRYIVESKALVESMKVRYAEIQVITETLLDIIKDEKQ